MILKNRKMARCLPLSLLPSIYVRVIFQNVRHVSNKFHLSFFFVPGNKCPFSLRVLCSLLALAMGLSASVRRTIFPLSSDFSPHVESIHCQHMRMEITVEFSTLFIVCNEILPSWQCKTFDQWENRFCLWKRSYVVIDAAEQQGALQAGGDCN